jgi:hypothetical protein
MNFGEILHFVQDGTYAFPSSLLVIPRAAKNRSDVRARLEA